MPTILIAECRQEVSSFNPVPSHYADFDVLAGDALIDYHRRVRDEVGGVEPDDPDFAAFLLIESETDDLPRAPDVAHWDPAVLAASEDEFARAEDWARPIARAACDALLRRFDADASPSPSP